MSETPAPYQASDADKAETPAAAELDPVVEGTTIHVEMLSTLSTGIQIHCKRSISRKLVNAILDGFKSQLVKRWQAERSHMLQNFYTIEVKPVEARAGSEVEIDVMNGDVHIATMTVDGYAFVGPDAPADD